MSDRPENRLIIVTGATGFVGSFLAGELIKEGYRVKALVRGGVVPPQVEKVYGDVTDKGSLEAACAGVDTVIHLVAVIREKGPATFDEVNYRGTVNMLQAAQNTGVKRFIHMSALGAGSDPRYRYAYSKWQAEEAVKLSSAEWTIIRPSVIYGRGFGFFNRLVQSLRLSPPLVAPVPGAGKSLFQPVAVEDVVRCVIRVVEGGVASRRVYDIGGPDYVSYAGMVDAVLRVLGQRRIKAPVPVFIMKAVVPLLEAVLRDPPVTAVELKQLELNNTTARDSIYSVFGFQPRELNEGLEAIRDYLRSL